MNRRDLNKFIDFKEILEERKKSEKEKSFSFFIEKPTEDLNYK